MYYVYMIVLILQLQFYLFDSIWVRPSRAENLSLVTPPNFPTSLDLTYSIPPALRYTFLAGSNPLEKTVSDRIGFDQNTWTWLDIDLCGIHPSERNYGYVSDQLCLAFLWLP